MGEKKTLEHLPPKIFNKIPVFAAISFDGQTELIANDKFAPSLARIALSGT